MRNKTFPVLIVCSIFFVLFFSALWFFHSNVDKLKHHWPALKFSSYQGYWGHGVLDDVGLISRGYRVELGDVYWDYDWLSIFSTVFFSKPCAFFYSDYPQNKLSFHACYQFSSQQLMLTNIHLSIGADNVGAIVGLDVSGAMKAYLSEVFLSKNRISKVEGNVQWQGALWRIGEKEVNLGRLDATMNVADENTGTRLVVNNTFSEVAINFTGFLDEKNRLSGKGYIDLGKEKDEALVTTLRFFSHSDSQGKFFFEKSVAVE